MIAASSSDSAAWQHASRRLLAKMLAEFAYEEVITPEADLAAGPTS